MAIDTQRVDVLVVGDWVVNEAWSLISHESPISFVTGSSHLRLPPGQPSTACRRQPGAAGQVLRTLLSPPVGFPPVPGDRVLGLGCWAEGHNELIAQMLSGACPCDCTGDPLMVTPGTAEHTTGRAVNLAAGFVTGGRDPVGTTRIVRLYRRNRTLKPPIELDRRVDFEGERLGIADSERCADLLPSAPPKPCKYVAVKDLNKGFMSPALLDVLQAKGWIDGDTEWYVSSSAISVADWGIHPDWLGELCSRRDKFGKIAVLLLPTPALRRAEVQHPVDEHWAANDLFADDWFIEGGHPTDQALAALSSTRRCLHPQETLIVALPQGASMLALDASDHLYAQHVSGVKRGESEIVGGRGSTVLSFLVADAVASGATDKPAGPLLQEALRIAEECVADRVRDLTGDGEAKPTKLEFDGSRELTKEWGYWQTTLGETGVGGIIDPDNQPRIELWRAMTPLDGYIETVTERREEVRRLVRLLRQFAGERPDHPVSVHIQAPPGSGKSYLVARLRKDVDLPLLQFNITQLIRRDNLIACFDAIASAQTQDRSRPYLVFFDEIDAKLENAAVYDLFLTVLEDGTYIREGRKFHLEPCAWIFAGTETQSQPTAGRSEPMSGAAGRVETRPRATNGPSDPAALGATPGTIAAHTETAETQPAVPKYSDFLSRLTLAVQRKVTLQARPDSVEIDV